MTFSGWPFIIEVSFLLGEVDKVSILPECSVLFSSILLHQLRNSFRYFCNLRLILQIPGACVLIAMPSAVTNIANIKNRGGDCLGEHHGWRCDWVTLLVINWDYFFWCQKELLIHLINFLFTPTDVSLKGSPSY